MLIEEVVAVGHLQVYSTRNVTCSGLPALSWQTSLHGTVRNAYACSRQGACVQGNPYHKWHGNGFLRCLPRKCLWALPSLASLEVVCDSQEEIFKEKKENATFMVLFQWKRRIKRKWQVQRERERNRNGISWKLWFVWGEWNEHSCHRARVDSMKRGQSLTCKQSETKRTFVFPGH